MPAPNTPRDSRARRGLLVACAVACAAGRASADPPSADPAIVPRPAQIELLGGEFEFTPRTAVLVKGTNPQVRAVAEELGRWLSRGAGRPVEVRTLGSDEKPDGDVVIAAGGQHRFPDEWYTLTVSPTALALFAGHPRGLVRGVQTIRQLFPPEFEVANRLAPPPPASAPAASAPATSAPGASTSRPVAWRIPCMRITDEPRYRWRGMLLDCGRHFMPVEQVKRTIDLLAFHKFNVLHWHLTEDQGWRIEIRKHPRLTEIGAWRTATRDSEQPRDGRGRYGGFYSQDDVREIVAYAAARYVTVVPEIELPGHCQAALAAYPELSCTGGPFEVSTRWGVHEDVYCAGNERVFEFLEDVFAEVVELFPSPYIHVGGDEVPKARWKNCPRCQTRIQTEGLKDEAELQSYFIRRIAKLLSARGKRLIGWDEILEGGLPPGATVQSWRGLDGAVAAASAGHDVICSPTSHCYLDYPHFKDEPDYPDWMGATSIEQAYSFEPTPASLAPDAAARVLGLEGNLWTEHVPPRRLDWQAFPRLCALAEVGWSPAAARDADDFLRRLETHSDRLAALGVRYHPPRHAATTPVARDAEPWWTERFAATRARIGRGNVELLFIGDSITQSWEDAGREIWERRFAPRGAVNLGFSGDRTQHVLWRLDHGQLDGLGRDGAPPRHAVLLIGTNNSNGDDHGPRQIADGVAAIVERLRVRLPATRVLVLGIFPRGPAPDAQRAKIEQANRMIELRVVEPPFVRFVDLGGRFVRPDGTIPAELMPDYLHLSGRGYELWADALEPLLAPDPPRETDAGGE